jgi:hypothetical protein
MINTEGHHMDLVVGDSELGDQLLLQGLGYSDHQVTSMQCKGVGLLFYPVVQGE